MTDEKAMAPPVCVHYWAWVSPAGTSESARLCMSCGQPNVDWLNEIAALRAPTPCPTCDGAGIVDTSPPGVEAAPWLATDTDCPRCDGRGEIPEETE